MKRSMKVGMLATAVVAMMLSTGCGPMGSMMGPMMGAVGSLGSVARQGGAAASASRTGPAASTTPDIFSRQAGIDLTNQIRNSGTGAPAGSAPAFDQMMQQQQADRAAAIATGAAQDSVDNGVGYTDANPGYEYRVTDRIDCRGNCR